jgi:hypothetical protein
MLHSTVHKQDDQEGTNFTLASPLPLRHISRRKIKKKLQICLCETTQKDVVHHHAYGIIVLV